MSTLTSIKFNLLSALEAERKIKLINFTPAEISTGAEGFYDEAEDVVYLGRHLCEAGDDRIKECLIHETVHMLQAYCSVDGTAQPLGWPIPTEWKDFFYSQVEGYEEWELPAEAEAFYVHLAREKWSASANILTRWVRGELTDFKAKVELGRLHFSKRKPKKE